MLPIIPVHYYVHLEKDDLDNKTEVELNLFQVLQLLANRFLDIKHTCPSCRQSWTDKIEGSMFNLRKVDFIWINRDQKSFEWFVDLLSHLEAEQQEHGGELGRFLKMQSTLISTFNFLIFQVPRDADVRHLRPAAQRHQGGRPPAGPRPDAQEGEERSAHWAEGSNERWPSQLDQSFYEGDRAVKPRNNHIFR